VKGGFVLYSRSLLCNEFHHCILAGFVEVRPLTLMIGEFHTKTWLKYSFYFFRKEISRFLVCVCAAFMVMHSCYLGVILLPWMINLSHVSLNGRIHQAPRAKMLPYFDPEYENFNQRINPPRS
jgi:hypothetical protein